MSPATRAAQSPLTSPSMSLLLVMTAPYSVSVRRRPLSV